MAIDTENKRRSAGTSFSMTTYPVPDSSIVAADRIHSSWLYSGIAILVATEIKIIIENTIYLARTVSHTVYLDRTISNDVYIV